MNAATQFPITYSIHFTERPTMTDTAKSIVKDIRAMSTQTKARLELLAIFVTLAVALGGVFKGWVLLEPRVEQLEAQQMELRAEMKAIQIKASATDVAIAGIMPQLAAIQQSLAEIKADVRDLRQASEHRP